MMLSSIKDETGKFIKTQEILSIKTLISQIEKYSEQYYKGYVQ